ncbi:MAG: hypothetical protein BACD_01632 [Bacteroides rodentium]
MERRVLTPSPEGLAVDLLSTLNKMCSNLLSALSKISSNLLSALSKISSDLLSALNEYVYICCIINKIKYG